MKAQDLNQNKIHEIKAVEEKYELVPPEGGWGVIVVLSMSTMFIITMLPLAVFGIVFGSFLAGVGDETAGTTIVNGIFNTALSFTGLAANQLLQKTSYRKVGILGAIIYFIGGFLTIFVNSLFQIIITFGILEGIGVGLMMPSVFTAFNHYYDKRKNLMMSVAQTLMVASAIGLPTLAKYLLHEFGFRGAVAIISALSLNCIPAMASLQPVKWHMKKQPLTTNHIEAIPEKEEEIVEGEPLLEANLKHLGLALERPRKSLVSMGSMAMSVSNINITQETETQESKGVWHSLAKSLDLGLFKDPSYVNISVGLSLSLTSDLAFISVLPLLLNTLGFNAQELTTIMTVYFSADLVSRILLSVLSAITILRNRYLFLMGSLFSALFRIAFVMNNSYWWILSTSAALGFLRCFVQTPLALVIAEAYPKRFVTAFSLYMVVCGIVSMIFGPLIGFVKEATNSHEMVVHVLTVAYLLCAIPWLLEIIYVKYIKKK